MRKNFKKVIALGMTVVLAFSVAGCSKSKSKNTQKGNEDEYGYNVEYIPLASNITDKEKLNTWINGMFLHGDTVYYSEMKANEDGTQFTTYLESFPISDPSKVKVYTEIKQETENSGVEIVYVFPDKNGNISRIQSDYSWDEDYVDEEDSSGIDLGDIPETDAITQEYLDTLGIDLSEFGLEFSDVSGMTVKEVVALYLNLKSDTEDKPDTEDDGYESKMNLVTVDADGKEIEKKEITGPSADFSPQYFALGKDGNLYMYSTIWMDNDDNPISQMGILNLESYELEVIDLALDDGDEINTITSTGDGTIVAAYSTYDSGEVSFATWNSKKKAFDIDKKNKIKKAYWVEYAFPAEGDSIFYVCDSVLYKHDMSDKKSEKVLKFLDWNISGDEYPVIAQINEKDLMVVSQSYEGEEQTTINKLTKVKKSEMKEKTEIVLGCYDSYEVEQAVVDFNRKNPDYKIVIKSFSDDTEDWEKVMNDFSEAVLSGEGIDIINLSQLPVDNYKNKGIFEDLYSYIAADEEMSKKNLNKNILKLYEDNGKLMGIPSAYTVECLVSPKSLLGDGKLTLDKFEEICKQNTDKEILSDATKESVLQKLYDTNAKKLVDVDNKTCNFTDGTFEKMLNIANTFISEEEAEKKWEEEENYVSDEKKIADGNLLFYQFQYYDMREYQILNAIFKDGFNITGNPSVEDSGLTAYSTGNVFAISSSSKHKDVCWQFVKDSFVNIDTQLGYGYGFSVDNDILEESLKQAATPEMVEDENGNMVEVENTYGFDEGFEIQVKALNQEQVQEVREILNSITVLGSYSNTSSTDVYSIIKEETAAFFAGEKTAAEVCELIQSRVNIVINEDN